MTDESKLRYQSLELMNRLTSEWMRACDERDWYITELVRAQQKIGDMLKHADELEKITHDCERRARDRDTLAAELLIAREEAKERKHWLWRVHDAAVAAEHIAPNHKTEEELVTCALEAIVKAIKRAKRFAVKDDDVLMRSLSEFEMSVRAANCLENAEIRLVGELVQKNAAEMLKSKNFGRMSLIEINKLLAGLGLKLGTHIPDWKERLERWKRQKRSGTS